MTSVRTFKGAVLIIPFSVFDGREVEFLDLSEQTSANIQREDRYVDAQLVADLSEQPPRERAPLTNVNVARWESAAAYADALTDLRLRRLGGQYLKVCTFNPALYKVLRFV